MTKSIAQSNSIFTVLSGCFLFAYKRSWGVSPRRHQWNHRPTNFVLSFHCSTFNSIVVVFILIFPFFFISWYDFLNHILWRRARSWENGDGPAVMSHVLTLLVTTRLHFVFLHELFLLLPRPPCTLLFRFLSRSSLQQGLFNNPSAKMSWCIATFLHCYLFAASNRTIKGVVFASFSSLVNVSVINLDCWREIRFVIILKNCSDENYGK